MANADAYVQLAVEASPVSETNAASVSSTVFYHPLEEFGWHVPPILDDRSNELRGFADNLPPDLIAFDVQTGTARFRMYPNLLPLWFWATHGAPTLVTGAGVSAADGAITQSTGAFTSASANFQPGDVGKTIVVRGAGASGADLVTTIATRSSTTAIGLTANAGTTVSGATYTYGSAGNNDPDGIPLPTGAYLWQFTAGTNNGAVRSLQAQAAYTDQSSYLKINGLAVEQLQLQHQGEVAEATASTKALVTKRIPNPSLSASYDAVTLKPFTRSMHTVLTWLGGSSVTNSAALSYTLNNPLIHDRTLSGSRFPDVVDRSGVDCRLTASLDLRNLTANDIDGFLNNTQFTVETRWKSPQAIGSSYPYQMWVQGNAVYSDLTAENLQHKIRHGVTLPIAFGRSTGGSPSYTISVVNTVSSYSSVG